MKSRMYVIVTPPTSARGLRKRCLIFATRKFGFIINVVFGHMYIGICKNDAQLIFNIAEMHIK